MIHPSEKRKKEYSFDDYLEYIDYSVSPIEELVQEVINERLHQELSQEELAKKIGTKQSVVSRFENLGRSPSFKWLIRLSKGLGTRFRATIHGDYMYVVPRKLRQSIAERASELGLTVEKLIDSQVTRFLTKEYNLVSWYTVLADKTPDNDNKKPMNDPFYLSSDSQMRFLTGREHLGEVLLEGRYGEAS